MKRKFQILLLTAFLKLQQGMKNFTGLLALSKHKHGHGYKTDAFLGLSHL